MYSSILYLADVSDTQLFVVTLCVKITEELTVTTTSDPHRRHTYWVYSLFFDTSCFLYAVVMTGEWYWEHRGEIPMRQMMCPIHFVSHNPLAQMSIRTLLSIYLLSQSLAVLWLQVWLGGNIVADFSCKRCYDVSYLAVLCGEASHVADHGMTYVNVASQLHV